MLSDLNGQESLWWVGGGWRMNLKYSLRSLQNQPNCQVVSVKLKDVVPTPSLKSQEPHSPDYLQTALAVGGPGLQCAEGRLEEGEGNDSIRGSKTFKGGISCPQPPRAFFTVSICLFRGCFQRNQGGLGILTDTCLVVTPPSSHGHVFLGGTTVCVLEVATLPLLDLSKSLDSCQ